MSTTALFTPAVATVRKYSDAELLERFQRRGPMAGVATLLGLEATAIDQEALRFAASFRARAELLNPLGQIQGGIQTAMLDELMSIAAIIAYEFRIVVPTLEIKTSYLKPVLGPRIDGWGRVLRKGRNIVFLEGALLGPDGAVHATATSTAMVVARPPREKAVGAAKA